MAKQYTVEEVSAHNTEKSAWIIVSDQVFDVTTFLTEHPGGKKVLLGVAGKDATKQFNLFHKPATLVKYSPKLKIGVIAGSKAAAAAPTASKSAAEQSSTQKSTAVVVANKGKQPSPASFGEMVPYGDPSWYQEWHSPYYNDSHRRFRLAMREFVEREIVPNATEWDESKGLPRDIWKRCADAGFLAGMVGKPWPTEYCNYPIAGGVKPEEWDYFHELILNDELARAGCGGVVWGIHIGIAVGLPPILHFANKSIQNKVCAPVLSGDKVICLAITEPYAGSDVAAIQTTAKLTADGKHYIVNGEKKWITNGIWADFFTVAVRTGTEGSGMNGISLLLLERSMGGITTKQMNCQGLWASGTSYITFEDVLVPVENLIGRANEGFKYIMQNFNHERFSICVQGMRFTRVCLEESMRYAFKRRTFGKLLIEHPVIRLKLAHMARQIEANQAQLENITYQMNQMSFEDSVRVLGGPIALLKAQISTSFEYCAREASQIFGGLAYTRGGQGEKVERLYREVRGFAIPGGSEEIMLDLGIRQAMKMYEKVLAKQSKL